MRKGRGGAQSLDVEVGTRLKARRLMLGGTQAELGRAVGVSYQQIQKYEMGRTQLTVNQLQKFADILQVDILYFFGDTGGDKQKSSREWLPSYVAELLELSQGKRLIQAFLRIEDQVVRRRIVALVELLGDQPPATKRPKSD